MTATRGEIRQAAFTALAAAGLSVGGAAVAVQSGRVRPPSSSGYPVLLVHTRESEQERQDKDSVWLALTELTVTALVVIGDDANADATAELQIETLTQAVYQTVLNDTALLALVQDIDGLSSTIADPEFVAQDGQGGTGRPVREAEVIFEVEHEMPL